jgi:hypothetical protein
LLEFSKNGVVGVLLKLSDWAKSSSGTYKKCPEALEINKDEKKNNGNISFL